MATGMIPRTRCVRLPTSIPAPAQCSIRRSSRRLYHSHDRPATDRIFSEAEEKILQAGLAHVPVLGFSRSALTRGANDAGYLDITANNLFPRGAFSLVQYHLVEQRRKLAESVEIDQKLAAEAEKGGTSPKKMGIGARVRQLTLRRLMANQEIIHQWQEALALMAQPSNVPIALAELHALADDIWYMAGDVSVDFSWYTKRATLSSVYAATDLFMTTDHSPGFQESEEFLDRRLEDLKIIGGTTGSVGQWLGFAASQGVNVLRSKGLRI